MSIDRRIIQLLRPARADDKASHFYVVIGREAIVRDCRSYRAALQFAGKLDRAEVMVREED